MYKIQSELNVLKLLNPIPSKIISILSNPELLEVTTKASKYINRLQKLLSGVTNLLYKELYKKKQSSQPKDEPYAGFKVDEKPLTGKQVQIEKEKQMSIFDYGEIKSQYEKENHNYPIKMTVFFVVLLMIISITITMVANVNARFVKMSLITKQNSMMS